MFDCHLGLVFGCFVSSDAGGIIGGFAVGGFAVADFFGRYLSIFVD